MKKYSFLFSFFLIQLVFSQQFNTSVVVNFESINQTNNSVFKNLENSIKLFIESTKWSDDNLDQYELINLNILFNVTRFSDNFFVGNMEFQSDRPVLNSTYSTPIFKYVDKNIQFEYVEFESIVFNQTQFSSNLSSILAFYVNIILGIDKESYELNSGDYFFNSAKNILNLANQNNNFGWDSSFSDGKNNKFWLIQTLSTDESKEFKAFYYNYHVNGLDLMSENIFEAKSNISISIFNLKPIQRRSPNSILLKIIFDTKSDEIKQIFSGGIYFDNSKLINHLNYLSPFFSNKWNSLR
ncbi:MAG: DUF4835 family protein [Flavobacteriaceae bacterium]|nr:DUF4835 family protein [Flavobacteriaceae bacterium]